MTATEYLELLEGANTKEEVLALRPLFEELSMLDKLFVNERLKAIMNEAEFELAGKKQKLAKMRSDLKAMNLLDKSRIQGENERCN